MQVVTKHAFSGPLLDRIDLQIEVPAVSALDLLDERPVETSAQISQRVIAARAIQAERFQKLTNDASMLNATCSATILNEISAPDQAGKALLREAAMKLNLSARGFHKALRVARTLADLEGKPSIERAHLAESLSYRGQSAQNTPQQAGSNQNVSQKMSF